MIGSLKEQVPGSEGRKKIYSHTFKYSHNGNCTSENGIWKQKEIKQIHYIIHIDYFQIYTVLNYFQIY